MTQHVNPRRRGSYGVDAPYGAATQLFLVLALLAFAILTRTIQMFLLVLFLSALVTCWFHTTLRGKFLVWAELLDGLQLRGDEQILDMGCGRGAVLLLAAQRLTTGRAVGVDVWRTVDQSGNSAAATQRNAVAEGVADRVELHTGNMMALPFADNSFEVVVSSLAIHNIGGTAGREKAIAEAVRVLRPGGRLLVADLKGTGHHQTQLAKMGMSAVARRRLGWRFWWGGPWISTYLVSATKPEQHTGN